MMELTNQKLIRRSGKVWLEELKTPTYILSLAAISQTVQQSVLNIFIGEEMIANMMFNMILFMEVRPRCIPT